MINNRFLLKSFVCFLLCLLTSIQVRSQITLIKDSLNHEIPIGFTFKSINSRNNQKIFNSNCRIEPSSNFLKVAVKEFSSPFDTNATISIYNDSGVVERTFVCPNLYDIKVRNDGAVVIYGSYHSMSILLDTYLYAYSNDGTLILSSQAFGPSISVKLIDNENYLFVMADSIGGTLIKKKKYVMVYDKNFDLLSKSLFDDDHSKHYLNLDSIDNQKKLIHFFYSDKMNKREKEFKMSYSGKIIN